MRTQAQLLGFAELRGKLPAERLAELLLLAVFSAAALEAGASLPRTGRRVQANSTILACAVEIGQCALCGLPVLVREFRRISDRLRDIPGGPQA